MRRKTVSLFLTHTPEAYRVGRIYEDPRSNGETYLITRLKRLTPTQLLTGELRDCYEVYGRRVT